MLWRQCKDNYQWWRMRCIYDSYSPSVIEAVLLPTVVFPALSQSGVTAAHRDSHDTPLWQSWLTMTCSIISQPLPIYSSSKHDLLTLLKILCRSWLIFICRDTSHIASWFWLTQSDMWCIFCHDRSWQSLETLTISAKKSLINFPIGLRIWSKFAKHQKVVPNTRRETALHIY